VANACSPPEDPNKAHLPKTFVCPRFMLFSREMAAAAQDDAVANGWEQGAFNYAVVGHDADAGGLDGAATSSCCQCYQLVFEKPEPGSPQPPELPIPKPLIVQSFNTAAGGPKNFDVFMGVGGFGAFNACVNDPTFSNTTKFGEFLYSAYPSEFPGNGGVKFLSYDECRSAGAVTVESLQSATCQARIASACGGVRSSIPAIAQDTVDSCVRSNRVASLYHQNWEVRARRVECPEALTRVTGCRLRAQGLPSPDPRVQTVQQADASFRPGYTTTTMQDCCKPSCAWKNLVEGMGVPADPDYRSFYSCDAAGAPITAQ
jgi:hypothetical protein